MNINNKKRILNLFKWKLLSFCKQKPFLQEGLLSVIFLTALAVHNFQFPFFYKSAHVFAKTGLFLWLFFTLIYLFAMHQRPLQKFHLPDLFLLSALLTIAILPINFSVLPLILLYYGSYLLAKHLSHLLLLYMLALSAFFALTMGLAEFHIMQLKEYTLLNSIRYFVGLKSSYSMTSFGSYAQANLFPVLLITGFYAYLNILILKKENFQIPAFFLSLPLTLFAFAIFLTRSRSAFLAFSITLLITFLIMNRRSFLNKKELGYYLAFPPLAGFFLAWLNKFSALTKIGSGFQNIDPSTYTRFNYWLSAIRMWLDAPFFGHGIGSYKVLLGDYAIETAEIFKLGYDTAGATLWAHNNFLHILAENGIFTLIFFCLALGCILFYGFKKAHTQSFPLLMAFSAFLIAMCFTRPFSHPGLVFCLALMAGSLVRNCPVAFHIRPRLFIPIIVTIFAISGAWVFEHARTMHMAHEIQQDLFSKKQNYSASDFLLTENKLDHLAAHPVYSFEFQHYYYQHLTGLAFRKRDKDLAAILLKKLDTYGKLNRFAHTSYLKARLCYVLGDYEQSYIHIWQAYNKEMHHAEYSNFIRIVNILRLSKANGIPVKNLAGEELYETLLKLNLLQEDQMSEDGVAL